MTRVHDRPAPTHLFPDMAPRPEDPADPGCPFCRRGDWLVRIRHAPGAVVPPGGRVISGDGGGPLVEHPAAAHFNACPDSRCHVRCCMSCIRLMRDHESECVPAARWYRERRAAHGAPAPPPPLEAATA